MCDFVYDKTVTDKENRVRVSVTVVDADPDSNVQINIDSGALRIPFFLGFDQTRLLAKYLQQACDVYDAQVKTEAWKRAREETQP